MDDPDLELLRSFRLAEAEPPDGLQARIEERLWQAMLAEEAARAHGRRRGRWYRDLLRPAVAAGAAGAIALGVAFAGGDGAGMSSRTQASSTQAGVLDSTAVSLFGEPAATGATSTPIVGSIDLRSSDDLDEALLRGPSVEDGELAGSGADVVREVTRDPAELQARLRTSAASAHGSAAADRAAFHAAMRWVVTPQVPSDLRAAMLRSLEGLDGVDAAIMGVDLLGRPGVVLGHLDHATAQRTQYLLDPEGGHLLEQRTFTTGYVDPACPPGTFTAHELYAEDGSSISPAEAPWLAWPLVVAACEPGSVS